MFEGRCASEVLQSAISVDPGDWDPFSSKDTAGIAELESTGAPENGHVGIRASTGLPSFFRAAEAGGRGFWKSWGRSRRGRLLRLSLLTMEEMVSGEMCWGERLWPRFSAGPWVPKGASQPLHMTAICSCSCVSNEVQCVLLPAII